MTAPTVMATHTEVALAWLKTVTSAPVATTLPSSTSWSVTGFVTAMPVGGVTNADVPFRRPAVSIDVWANNPDSNQPPWGKANSLAEAIYSAAYDPSHLEKTLTVAGHQVRVFSPYPLSEPVRVSNDEAGYAHLVFTLELPWVAL